VRLPTTSVLPVYRSDSSGTTNVFTSYLRAAAGGWEQGSGFDVGFPRGQGAQGSDGVVAAVKRSAGAIGYVSPAHARREGLGVALLGNRAGRFLAPTTDAVNAALVGASGRPFGTTAKLLFTPDSPGAYPLATLSYVLFPRKMADPAKATALRHFAAWALAQGQRVAEQLGYTPVPRQFQVTALAEVERD
jgi:phosphate transport system substrate-binding protein